MAGAVHASGNGWQQSGPAGSWDGRNPALQTYSGIAFPAAASPMAAGDLTSYPRRSLFVNIVPSFSRIYNEDIYGDETWESSGGFGFGLEVGYALRLSKLFHMGAGLGVSSYQSEIAISEYDHSFEELLTDIDDDQYKGSIQLDDIREKTQLIYLDVPVYVEMGRANTGRLSWYARLGVKVSYPLSYNYMSDGTQSLSGYYPELWTELYGIPELGFVKDAPIDKNEENILNTINLTAMFSAGLTIPVSDFFIFKVGGNINYGLLEISSEKVVNQALNQYSSVNNTLLTAPDSKTTTQWAGLEIGIIYVLQAIY